MGGFWSSADAGGAKAADDLDNIEPRTPCDEFSGASPPCDPDEDLISECNFGSGVSFGFKPTVVVSPHAVLELMLLPLEGLEAGEGGQGGSAGASNLAGYRVEVRASSAQIRSNEDGSFSLLAPGVTLSFRLDPVAVNVFLQPLGGWSDPRAGTIALVEAGAILEQRRIFLFAESNCLVP